MNRIVNIRYSECAATVKGSLHPQSGPNSQAENSAPRLKYLSLFFKPRRRQLGFLLGRPSNWFWVPISEFPNKNGEEGAEERGSLDENKQEVGRAQGAARITQVAHLVLYTLWKAEEQVF